MSFIVGLFVMAVVQMIVTLLVAGREKQIWAWLQSRPGHCTRRFYRQMCIAAVQGRVTAFPTVMLTFLVLLGLLLLAAVVTAGTVYVETQAVDVRRILQNLDRGGDGVATVTQRDLSVLRDTVGLAKDIDALREQVELLRTDLEGARNSAREEAQLLLADLEGMSRNQQLVARGVAALFYFLLLLWFPYVVLLSRTAFELERVTNRIRLLGTTEERRELALAESSVKDAESLNEYLEKLANVAARNGVSGLLVPFSLGK